MRITALGHIAFLFEMAPRGREAPVRILCDPWLSDCVSGDLLGRFPRLRFDPRELGPVHGLFISHAHTDHLDPDSLLDLWRRLDPLPPLLLPQTLRAFEPLLRERLPGAEIVRLEQGAPVDFRGLRLSAFLNPEQRATNEDDVMVLVAESGREALVYEADACLPFYDPGTRDRVAEPLVAPGVETAVFVTAKNELDATMSMLDARDLEDRHARLGRCLERTYEDVEETFAPAEGAEADPWASPRVVRLVGGQGMCWPQELGTEWNRVLFPIRIEDRVRIEREIAAQHELPVSVETLVPGEVHVVEGGRLAARERAPGLELLDREEDRVFHPELELFEDLPVAPLRDEARDRSAQEARILETLHTRFLPWLIGARSPPLEHLIAAGGGAYRIRVRHGTAAQAEDIDLRIGFDRLRFAPEPAAEAPADEHYWANDIADVLDGRADEFSTVCRHPLPGAAQRLWTCLGLPFLNQDLVERKLRYHFDRAARGETVGEWALRFWRR